MIVFRHVDPRFPFLWEGLDQPSARWHGEGEGPVHYFADTPDGAWAEFLRHEEIRDPADLPTIRRSLWAVELHEEPAATPKLAESTVRGDHTSYPACQEEARRVRRTGVRRIHAPSAALRPGDARGLRVESGLQPGPPRDGRVIVLFGSRPDLVGWRAVAEGHPGEDILRRVRHFGVRRG
ncbi:MAG: RES domain-containing protein [Candidatus Binatia bacterium]